jgi:alkaline phosphatase
MLLAFSMILFQSIAFCAFKEKTKQKPNKRVKAKNIVVMISDGCDYNHVDAASLYQYGETRTQVYEHFPFRLGMSTYMNGQTYEPQNAWRDFNYVKYGYTDSAAAATAISCGVKTYSGAIGVDITGSPVTHIIERAEEQGKATGVVTSVQFSHATPAGFVAHNTSRSNYADIANEMIYESALEVIMGCGHPLYTDDHMQWFTKVPYSYEYKYVGGIYTWYDLAGGSATGADADGDGITDEWTVIQTRYEFQDLINNPAPPKRVIGIPQVLRTLQQKRSGNRYADPYIEPFNEGVPTLEEMTGAALNILDEDPDGFFLMVEGGAVDWASHSNQPGRLIEEQVDFNRAVEAVVDWVRENSNWGETLLIVTADHETGYLTGLNSGQTVDGPVWNELTNNGIGSLPGMEWHSGGHTNSLVPFYAKGRGSWGFMIKALFGRQKDPVRWYYIDNTDIADVIFNLLQ